MKTYGYTRCSTNEDKQDINRQIRELRAAGADEVVFEYEHGDAKVKKELHMLLDMAASGDTIITLEVSRLSRSTQQLCEILDIVKEKHLRLMIVGSITIDCRKGEVDPMSKAFLEMSGVFAELELSMIRARVRSGMQNARDKGRKIATTVFKVAYVLLVIVSAIMDGELAWAISDTFNGLMTLPNLIGLVIMSGLVVKLTKNYFDRKSGKDVEPMLSAYEDMNEQFKKDLAIESQE